MTEVPESGTHRAVATWSRLSAEPIEGSDLAEEYHEASKFYRPTIRRQVRIDRLLADADLATSAGMGARDLPHLPRLPLPAADPRRLPVPLARRPSHRAFDPGPLPVEVIGDLLAFSYGEQVGSGEVARRPVASAGGLYPLELYLLAEVTDEGRKGVYHYDVAGHRLEEVRSGVSAELLDRLAADVAVTEVPLVIVVTALFARSRFKYGLRGYRFCLIEAGALIQQVQLVAQAMNLVSVPYAGFFDDAVEELCEIDGVDESFVNAILIGGPDE